MKILIVEDTIAIWEAVSEYLQACGHTVTRLTSCQQYSQYRSYVDCGVIDRMLPDGDGLSIARQLKSRDIPVIMMTAKSQIDDKIAWFDAGVDDYLTKPFDLKELELRIDAVTKRYTNTMWSWHDVSVDRDMQTVAKSWITVQLTNKEYNILDMLITSKSALSRTAILEEVWWWESIWWADAKLDVHISSLRKKLWKDLITTIKWFWYKIDWQNNNN